MSAPGHRLPDWSSRLQRLILARRRAPFVWGANDCFLFAADCAEACTGHDPAAELRYAYATEREALRKMQEVGDLITLAATRFGPEVPPALAQRGDVGLTVQAGRLLLCVCNGLTWLAPTAEGLAEAPVPHRAWRVAACPRC